MKNHLNAVDSLLVVDNPRAVERSPTSRSYITTNLMVSLEKHL